MHIYYATLCIPGCILVVYPSQDIINTVRRLPCDLGSQSYVFGHVQNSPPRPFSCFCSHDHSQSTRTNVRQSCAFLHFILSFCDRTGPKSILRHVYVCCYHLLQNQVHENAQIPILLILLFPITKTCRALVWDTTWMVFHRSQHGPKPSCDRGFIIKQVTISSFGVHLTLSFVNIHARFNPLWTSVINKLSRLDIEQRFYS